MAAATVLRINGVDLYHEISGAGEPVVLVHGSWTDHTTWELVAPRLAESFRVVTYDRRGHSRSERPTGQGSRRLDEDDLAALIEALDLAPAHVVGNSYGASIALGLATRRPDIVRTVVAHEPPLLGVVPRHAPARRQVDEVEVRFDAVAAQLRAGDLEQGVFRFVEEIALGPGWWAQLPAARRRTMVDNAATFLDMLGDPHWADLGVGTVPTPIVPVLLTDGEQSPTWLPQIVAVLDRAFADAVRYTFPGAGHVPQLSHASDFVHVVRTFLAPATPSSDLWRDVPPQV